MWQRGSGERPETIRVAVHQGGVLVIDEPRRGDRLVAVVTVGELWGRGQHLHVHPRPVHQAQPGSELGTAAGAHAALGAGVGLAESDEHVQVVGGPVVRMHIDPHAWPPQRCPKADAGIVAHERAA